MRRRGKAEPDELLPLPEPLSLATAREWVNAHGDRPEEQRRDAWRCLRLAELCGEFDPDELRYGVWLENAGREWGWWE